MRVLLLVAVMLAAFATDVLAQARVVKTPAAILSAPKGSAIGSVRVGTELRVLETRGAYARVSVTGFVERSRVSAQRGKSARRVGNRVATLRARGAAAARTLASLDAGTTVTVGGSAPAGWVRVSRTGWVLRSALAAPATTTAPRSVAKSAPRSTTKARSTPAKTPTPPRRTEAAAASPRVESKASAGDVESPLPKEEVAARNGIPAAIVAGASSTAPLVSVVAAPGSVASVPAASVPAPVARAVEPLSDSALVPTTNVALRTAPDARALATIAQGTPMVPLARDRGWVRVRVEGWVPERDLAPADSSVRSNVSAADLRADPQGSRGKLLRWQVQVLARQTADALRRDLAENETYLLARGPADENSLLYLVVPPSLLESTKSISTLADVMITARVRTGKSDLVGVPILDLLTITPRK